MMKACMKESGLTFEEKEVTQLSNAFFQDAVKEGRDRITAEDLKLQLKKYNGLLESMNISITKWLIPAKPKSSGTTSQTIWPNRPKILTRLYWENNFSFAFFMLIITLFNVLLFIQRAYYFKDFANLSGSKPNPFYMISRGFGRILLFNSVLILVLVLRYSLTFLRSLGLGSYLPVDHNIFIHKVIGWIIFGSAWIHAVMHFCNFAINVQPNPVKFLQLTQEYWKPHTNDNSTLGYLTKIGYNVPEGCFLVKTREEYNTTFEFPNRTKEYNTAELEDCPEGDANSDLLVCQACPEGFDEWSYFDIILTNQPGVFGFPGGMANPSGVALLAIITVMTICSLPFIRRSGNFKVFYFSHKLYLLFWGLLFLHAPEWYKWFLAPGIIWAAEKLYRRITSLLGRGKTTIQDGIILPSKVTNLVIKRSHGFNFTPGDWVFIKVPKLTKYEWHPFTISSAPEVKDTFTLHIRGVGSWTNKLHAHFQEVNKESKLRTLLSSPIELEIKARSHSGIADIERESTNEPLEILIDGPFGSPSSDIYRAEHAVLIATGIGVTPYASILQSIMHRYRMIKTKCPNCDHQFTEDLSKTMENLKKVDFIWVNRDQKSFEWFVKLLSQLEIEQEEQAGGLDKFLEMHMYVTSALQKTDMKAVGLQIALDLIYQKEKRDLVTGLKSRTNAGRPNWNKVFTKIREQNKGRVTVFYCGNPTVARMVREKCAQFGFAFKKEVF
jgi:ferredoxin-NADP reductase